VKAESDTAFERVRLCFCRPPSASQRGRNFFVPRVNHLQMVTGAVEPTDADLVERALGGDRDAFEAIYCRFQAVVYRFARAMTNSPAAAEDVTQEVFVALMRDLAHYDPQRARLSTYLYGMARNVTRVRLRRERAFVNLDDASADGWEPAGSDDPSAALSEAQDLHRLRNAIVSLPSRYREAVILCALHGLSYSDAAVAIGIPVSTVRSRLHRGRALLAERLSRVDAARSRMVDARVARCLA
jgi:RNA polymerase sigma-70 factor (ECF subfamily)